MYLLIINLYELGQFLRIMLWIALPTGIVSMLVTTFLQYRRSWREKGGWRLAMEGGAGERGGVKGPPVEAGAMSHPGYGKGAGFDGQGPGGYGQGARGYGQGSGGQDDPGAPADERTEAGSRPEDEDIDWNDGNENMYLGILWMKEKYERYRELTDQRYERLREELGRSEQRYKDLLQTVEESKGRPLGVGQPHGVEQPHVAEQQHGVGQPQVAEQQHGVGQPQVAKQQHEVGQQHGVARAYGVEEPHPYDLLAGELNAKQAIIEELEEQLRVERLRVEELIVKLQTNGQLLQQIYIELDKSYSLQRPSAE